MRSHKGETLYRQIKTGPLLCQGSSGPAALAGLIEKALAMGKEETGGQGKLFAGGMRLYSVWKKQAETGCEDEVVL